MTVTTALLTVLLLVLSLLPPATLSLAASSPKIAVLGGTGNLGKQTIREFLDRGISVKALVRQSSVDKFPEEFRSSPLLEIVTGEFLAEESASSSSTEDGERLFDDASVAPSAELLSCLEGCTGVVACYGATRRTKFTDLFSDPEDIDPTHAKQINYRSIIALVAAAKASDTIKHIVRVTGKGEDPTSFFSVLLNGLGAYCKAWNYQGETVLRNALADTDSIGYTIVRPGIMKLEETNDVESGDTATTTTTATKTFHPDKDDLVLADDGGNDLKVTVVSYTQIANLLVELVVSSGGAQKVTLAAMNPSESAESDSDSDSGGETPKATLVEKIAALNNDRRKFPQSLVAEHKAAVKSFFTKVAVVVSILGIGLLKLVSKLFF